ncbi:MAG: hypothetical protein WCA46_03750 [Actinocatenispora sp.]
MTEPLSGRAFVDLADDLVTSLGTRLPEPERSDVREDIADWLQTPDLFIRNLAGFLVHQRIPLRPAEREMAIRLMRAQEIDLALADEFTVLDGPPEP